MPLAQISTRQTHVRAYMEVVGKLQVVGEVECVGTSNISSPLSIPLILNPDKATAAAGTMLQGLTRKT